jgi:predicted MFS family arabinose efflux permease
MTSAVQDGWGSARTIGLLAASAALVAAFVGIELRSPAPLLPLRIFRLRTLSVANVTMAILGATAFSEFFLLTLYMQDVLHYSPMQTGAAFAAFALTVVLFSNVAQAVVSRFGPRAVLTAGLVVQAGSLVLLSRLPVDGEYVRDILPGFVLGGAGMGLSFVPITIASLTGVRPAEAGIASGLINTSRQIGGAVGVAAVTAIAAASTSSYLDTHAGIAATSGAALDHGFRTAVYALAGAAVVAALLAAGLLKPARPAEAEPAAVEDYEIVEEAA